MAGLRIHEIRAERVEGIPPDPEPPATPTSRTIHVSAESRLVTVPSESRVLEVR